MPGEPEQIQLFDHGPNVIELRTRAALFVASAQAENTRTGYASDWRIFTRWCTEAGRAALPATADTLRLFIVDELQRRKVSTVARHIAAIEDKHRAHKLATPYTHEIRELMRGARRTHGTAPRQKAALDPRDLRKMCTELLRIGTRTAARDRALLTLGFAAGMRRSELTGLDVDDLQFAPKGVAVTLRKSKTDQDGNGRQVGIFYGKHKSSCPVRALQAWLKLRGAAPGPLFPGQTGRLSGEAIFQRVKHAATIAGLNAADYAPHSLRAGCVTAAILAGAATPLIMKRTGHRAIATLEKYVRTASLFTTDVLSRAM